VLAATGRLVEALLLRPQGRSEYLMNSDRYPGDDVIVDPFIERTYSIDIHATPPLIWPWIVQLGYHRAGWYIDTWWDRFAQEFLWPRLVPTEARGEYRPPAERILPELQSLQVGDVIPDGPPGSAFYDIIAMEENRLLLLDSSSHFKYMAPGFLRGSRFEPHGEFSWVFILDEIQDSVTRVTSRWRGKGGPRLIMYLWKPVVLIADHFHQREILKGLKRRVERSRR
jgi:hypothetical protein